MDLLSSWILFPLILGFVGVGAGLLVERAAGVRIPGPLLLPVGLAAAIVAASFATATDATAELAVPLVVLIALAGFVIPGWWRGRTFDPWPWVAALAAYVVFLAPVAFSGELTFAGYIKLDDTSTWFALTDRVMEHGRSIEGLAPSTYEATLFFNLAQGYPLGVFFPLGVGSALVGQDVAWVFQPYVAFLGAALALALHSIAAPLIASSRLRAVAAFVAAQSALLLGYSLWGGVKEVAAAMIVVLLAALIETLIRGRTWTWRATLPLAVATAAAISVMSPAGATLWLGPLLLPALLATLGRPSAMKTWIAFAAATAVLTVPWLVDSGFVPPTSSSVTSETAQGNLIEPLSFLQVFGIWPTGDFRVDPVVPGIAYALIALVVVAGAYGVARAWQSRAWGLVLYVQAALVGALASQILASPWVAAKGLAIASPAPLILALVGCVALLYAGRRLAPLAIAGVAALTAGVLWSSVLAYHEVNLAPADRLAELEDIGEQIQGEGPALMTDYEPYGVRHFLREADPEGASELRRRIVPAREDTGNPCGDVRSPEALTCVPKGDSADIDELQFSGVLEYRTLVLRRSPVASRPPSPYERTLQGTYYEVWQRPVEVARPIAAHLSLGDSLQPGDESRSCATTKRAAATAGPEGKVVAVEREQPVVVPLHEAVLPAGWAPVAEDSGVLPSGDGTVTVSAALPAGRYSVWVGGAFRGRVAVAIDRELAGAARDELSFPERFIELGEISLDRGDHTVMLSYQSDSFLRPGVGGPPFTLGPIVLSADGPEPRLTTLPAARADELCGASLDWVEAVAPG